MIRIALSSDAKGHGNSATLIASILRRTKSPVHVRCWCRDYLPESFQLGSLEVEFFPAAEEVSGRYPGHVNRAVFDRLRIIRDGTDWDRCLIMDHDMVALCDLAPYFAEDFEETLLMGRLFGPGNTLGLQMKQRGGLPEGWKHAEGYPYFFMGPMMNLVAMREEGIWDKLLEAHAAIGQDEQLALTAACGGRTKGVAKKWNLVPQWDHLATVELPEGERVEVAGIPWRKGLPEGIIHWTGPSKPWHRGAKTWRPDIWEAERVTWEHLRMGIWGKPLMVEVEADDDRAAEALAKRGCRVLSLSAARSMPRGPEFPDWNREVASAESFRQALDCEAAELDSVRIGQWIDAGGWLGSLSQLPRHVVLRGARSAAEIARVTGLGYGREAKIQPAEWPAGGPLAKVLNYQQIGRAGALASDEELYLKRDGAKIEIATEDCPPRPVTPLRIGVAVIAIGAYGQFIHPLLRSIRRNFLPEHEVTVFLFADASGISGPGIEVIPLERPAGISIAPGSFATLRDHATRFGAMDYLYHLAADRLVVSPVGEEILGERVATLHPGYQDKPREALPYERRTTSKARVAQDEGNSYYAGSFYGGELASFLRTVGEIASAMEEDTVRGVTAIWHDESHWNRHLIDRPPTVELSPAYAGHANRLTTGISPKISAAFKNEADFRIVGSPKETAGHGG